MIPGFAEAPTRRQPLRINRLLSFAASLTLHGLVLTGLLLTPHLAVPPIKQDVETVRKRAVLVWYPPRTPDLAPQRATAKANPILQKVPTAQRTILTTNATVVRRQIIWQQPPKVELAKEQPSPNMILLNKAEAPAPPPILVKPPEPPPPPPKPSPRQFVPPPQVKQAGKTIGGTGTSPNEAPPTVATGGLNSRLNTVVLGLDPTNTPQPPPPGILTGAVTARPEDKAAAIGGGASGVRPTVVAPEVIAVGKSSQPGGPPAVVTPAPPKQAPGPKATPEQRARASARATVSAPLRGAARVVPRVVDTVFGSQTIYTTVLDIPDRNDLYGAIWFAERDAPGGSGGYALMRAPVLALAGLPAANPPKSTRIHLKLAIGKDGLVRSADLLSQAADPHGQALAKTALQWEFVPAMKAGQPVEITAVVEISF